VKSFLGAFQNYNQNQDKDKDLRFKSDNRMLNSPSNNNRPYIINF
jgi:hypothetical protein